MTNDIETDAILLDVEKDISKSFNAVLGATIAVCIVFLFLSANFGNAVTQITGENDSSNGEYVPLWEAIFARLQYGRTSWVCIGERYI